VERNPKKTFQWLEESLFTYLHIVAVFQDITGGGANGLNLPIFLEETRVLDKYLGIFVDYTYVSCEKVYKK